MSLKSVTFCLYWLRVILCLHWKKVTVVQMVWVLALGPAPLLRLY